VKKISEEMNYEIIDWLLSGGRGVTFDSCADFASFRRVFHGAAGSWEAPVDRAVVGGFAADCFAYAFAAGYGCALQRLVPAIPADALACFCITEEGGGHPRAIAARIDPSGDRGDAFTLSGRKKYITCAKEADVFLVAASDGIRADGTNSIRMVKIEAGTPGVNLQVMDTLRLVPEISHCEIMFDDVPVSAAEMLPGDGYTDYIKPFRTIEDLHVSAAILGYLFRNARIYGWGREVMERIAGLIVSVRSLALEPPGASSVHIVMDDVLKQIKLMVESLDPLWEKAGESAKQAWARDKAVMNIADKARAARLQRAWKNYSF
jgi:acyl-CoA dehydrogenase